MVLTEADIQRLTEKVTASVVAEVVKLLGVGQVRHEGASTHTSLETRLVNRQVAAGGPEAIKQRNKEIVAKKRAELRAMGKR